MSTQLDYECSDLQDCKKENSQTSQGTVSIFNYHNSATQGHVLTLLASAFKQLGKIRESFHLVLCESEFNFFFVTLRF